MKSAFWKSFWIGLGTALGAIISFLIWFFTRKPVPYTGAVPDPQAAARLEEARKKEEERIAAEIAAAGNEALAHMFNESIKKEKGKT